MLKVSVVIVHSVVDRLLLIVFICSSRLTAIASWLGGWPESVVAEPAAAAPPETRRLFCGLILNQTEPSKSRYAISNRMTIRGNGLRRRLRGEILELSCGLLFLTIES